MYDLSRFVEGYNLSYETARAELMAGLKQSHWMWYIFPQLKGLGQSEMSQYYGLSGVEEAKAFFDDDCLRERFLDLFQIINKMPDRKAVIKCFGLIDVLKLHSCTTLFLIATKKRIFRITINKFFLGKKDENTLKLLYFQKKS